MKTKIVNNIVLSIVIVLAMTATAQAECVVRNYANEATRLDNSNVLQKRLARKVRRIAMRSGQFRRRKLRKRVRSILSLLRTNQTVSLRFPVETFDRSCSTELTCIEEDTSTLVEQYGRNSVKACNKISYLLYDLERTRVMRPKRVDRINARNINIAKDINEALNVLPNSAIQCA